MTDLLRPGEPAIEFELQDIQGNVVRLSDSRGRPVVLAFLPAYLTVLPRAVGTLAR